MKPEFFQRDTESPTRGGYILILTILVISILLAIGIGVNTINIKEVMLSTFLRDSEKALTAAIRGVECTLYWDRSYPQNGFAYSIFASSSAWVAPSNLNSAVCNNGTADIQLSAIWDNVTDTTAATGTTRFNLSFSDGTCVDVSVVKVGDESTSVVGDGYNTCAVAIPRRTQREISVFSNI